jgi:PIN like domain
MAAGVRGKRWAALARDTKIMERPEEIAAFRRAKIHIFYYPGCRGVGPLHLAARGWSQRMYDSAFSQGREALDGLTGGYTICRGRS